MVVLADAQRQGRVPRNMAEHVDRVVLEHDAVDTSSETEVAALLSAIESDGIGHAWERASQDDAIKAAGASLDRVIRQL